MILKFAGEPSTTATWAPARSTRLASSVPTNPSAAASAKARLQEFAAEALGSLRLHDVLAGNGGGDDGSVGGALHLLDGVDGGQADDGGVVLFDGANGAVDGGRVDERTDGIVDQNDVVGVAFDGVERVVYAFLAMVAAFDDVDLVRQSRTRGPAR